MGLGLRLRDVPHTIGWDGLKVILQNLPMESAYVRALFPDYYAFSSPLKQSLILVDLINSISWLRYEYAMSMSGKGKKPDQPKPYPTPWNQDATPDRPFSGRYGKGAISSTDFWDWYYGKDGGT